MTIIDPGFQTINAAARGLPVAIDTLLLSIQPGVFNLSVRMLGNRNDAADASQEILLKVFTHLGSCESRSAFTTWVFQIARNHLLTAITRAKESPEVSLDAIHERLQQGLTFGVARLNMTAMTTFPTPEDQVEARQVALGCTQNMLMGLDREQRLIYVLDTVLGLPSKEAAKVPGISPEAFRQRLTRARAKLEAFTGTNCGLMNPSAACTCEKQLRAIRCVRAQGDTQASSLP